LTSWNPIPVSSVYSLQSVSNTEFHFL
jgi:hypothetical protein